MPWLDRDVPFYSFIKDKTRNSKKVLADILERYIFHLEQSSFSDSYIQENEEWLKAKAFR
jgi:hypothetical protein